MIARPCGCGSTPEKLNCMGIFRAHDAIYDLQIPHGLANVGTNIPFSIILAMNAMLLQE